MAFGVMGVVESEVLRPIPGLGQAQDGSQKRRIIRPPFQRSDLHRRAVWQLRFGRQHHDAILDCPFEAHSHCLAQDAHQRKPGRNASRNLLVDFGLRTLDSVMIYLDHNATTPVLPGVFEAMRSCFCEK